MKKIYALIATVAMGGMISASAQYLYEKPVKVPGQPQKLEAVNLLPNDTQKAAKPMKAPARAGENSVDLTTFTQMMYYDYFWNWNDYAAGATKGTVRDEFRGVTSSVEISYEVTEDGIALDNFFGYENASMEENSKIKDYVKPMIYVNDEGKLMFKLGKWFYVPSNKYNYYFAILGEEKDEDGYNIPVYEGEVELDVYLDGWVYDGYLGVIILDNSGNVLGWSDLGVRVMGLYPNATIVYDAVYSDEVKPVENNIYAAYVEADSDDAEDVDCIVLSNIIPFNMGPSITFGILGEDAIARNQIAYQSQTNSNKYTGDFYWYVFDSAENALTDNMVPATFIDKGNEVYELSWDCETMPYTEANYWLGFYASSTVVTINLSSGINSAIADESATNGPAEYYNLQGVKVANPTAGQIYIVKEGSKVSKQIIR